MKSLAVALVGVGAMAFACANHDNPTIPNPPAPTDTIPPVRPVVFDAGLVTLSGDGGGGLPGPPGSVQTTPDAAEEPDVAPEFTMPDGGGLGAPCDPLATQTVCAKTLQCSANPLDGTGTCQQLGTVLPTGYCDDIQLCGPQLACITMNGTSSCTNLCLQNQTTAPYCGTSIGNRCARLGTSTIVGYCSAD